MTVLNSVADLIFVSLVGVGLFTAACLLYLLLSVFSCRFWRGSSLAALWIALVVTFLVFYAPTLADKAINKVVYDPALKKYPLSSEAIALHRSLQVSDLHADSLMWNARDLLARNNFSHVDLPRLVEGRVVIQAFTLVTSSPVGLNFNSNQEPNSIFTDVMALKSFLEGWGGAGTTHVLHSKLARGLYMADRLHALQEDTKKKKNQNKKNGGAAILSVIKTSEDLKQVLQQDVNFMQSNSSGAIVGAFLGVEGLHMLDGDWRNVERIWNAGVRMAALTHFFDNSLGGSAHGVTKGGLTDVGKKVLQEMHRLGMMLDVAHASHQLISDVINYNRNVLRRKKKQEKKDHHDDDHDDGSDHGLLIMTSHTGLQSVCPESVERNLMDQEVRDIAETGGVIAVTFFSPALCGESLLESLLDTIDKVVELVGVEHVALGSDFDGSVATPFDASGMAHITQGLMRRGYNNDHIRLIMGQNTINMLMKALPKK